MTDAWIVKIPTTSRSTTTIPMRSTISILAASPFQTVNASSPLTLGNKYVSTDDGDLFPSYASAVGKAPFVYFDSRTYDQFDAVIGDFNGYASVTSPNFGAVRPYRSTNIVNNTGGAYASAIAASAAWEFMKPDSFQIAAPGLDGNFGNVASFDVDGDGTADPIYFVYPSGQAIGLFGGGDSTRWTCWSTR